jgi:hypothetical protein
MQDMVPPVCATLLSIFSKSFDINVSAGTEFKMIHLQSLAFSVQPFKCQVFSCGQNTIQFKHPLWDRVFLIGQKGCIILGTTLSFSSIKFRFISMVAINQSFMTNDKRDHLADILSCEKQFQLLHTDASVWVHVENITLEL